VIKAGCIDGEDASMTYVPETEPFTRSRAPRVPTVEGAKEEIGNVRTVVFLLKRETKSSLQWPRFLATGIYGFVRLASWQP